MPRSERDQSKSPSNPLHGYTVSESPITSPEDIDGIDSVVVMSEDGAGRYDAETVHADLLKRRPRITPKSLSDIVSTANTAWALEDIAEGDDC